MSHSPGPRTPVLHVVNSSSRQSYVGDFGDTWLYTCGPLVKCHLESPALLGQDLREEDYHFNFADEQTEA